MKQIKIRKICNILVVPEGLQVKNQSYHQGNFNFLKAMTLLVKKGVKSAFSALGWSRLEGGKEMQCPPTIVELLLKI